MDKIASMIFPGYVWKDDWDSAYALAQPAAIAALGFNMMSLQTTYTPADATDVNPSTATAVALVDITAMTAAAKAAGLQVCLKPHLSPPGGGVGYVPGAQIGHSGILSLGSPEVSATGLTLTGGNVGDRIVTADYDWPTSIPNSRPSDDYGHVRPTWTRIASVESATELTMTANATVYSGSANVFVLNEAATAPFFTNWEAILMDLLDAADAGGGADAINITTENDLLTCWFEPQWRSIVANIRAAYPGVKIYVDGGLPISQGAEFSTPLDMTRVSFLDVLDYIALSAYPTVGTEAGGDTVGFMEDKWAAAVAGLEAYSQSWDNKPVLFGELGTIPIRGAGFEPYSSRDYAGVWDVTFTSGSPTLTVVSGGFSGMSANQYAFVEYAASGSPTLPAGVKISSVVGNTLTLNANATGSGVGALGSITPQPSGTDQATLFTSAVTTVWDEAWFAGFNWWTWYSANENIATHQDLGVSFAPNAAARTAMADFLSRASHPRLLRRGNSRYRLRT